MVWLPRDPFILPVAGRLWSAPGFLSVAFTGSICKLASLSGHETPVPTSCQGSGSRVLAAPAGAGCDQENLWPGPAASRTLRNDWLWAVGTTDTSIVLCGQAVWSVSE